MATIQPTAFTISGSGFTANSTATLRVLDSSGANTSTYTLTTDFNGNIIPAPATIPSTEVLSLDPSAAGGTFQGSFVVVDDSTALYSNEVPFTLTVQVLLTGVLSVAKYKTATGGDDIVVAGTGFTPGGKYTYTLSSEAVNGHPAGYYMYGSQVVYADSGGNVGPFYSALDFAGFPYSVDISVGLAAAVYTVPATSAGF